MIRVAVFASGKGSNFEALAEYFRKSRQVKIACLISDQPGAGALEIARQRGIPAYLVECSVYKTRLDEAAEHKVIEILKGERIDLIVLAGFMRILKLDLLSQFRDRIINIHPSLLPAFPGLHAVKQAFDYGVKITGCTVHRVDEMIDHGKILGQRPVLVSEKDTLESLEQKIHVQEHRLYPAVLREVVKKMNKEKGLKK